MTIEPIGNAAPIGDDVVDAGFQRRVLQTRTGSVKLLPDSFRAVHVQALVLIRDVIVVVIRSSKVNLVETNISFISPFFKSNIQSLHSIGIL